ncbi:MAG TPA: hypothetical protein VL945_01660 [Candidatus Saccharimonadales bacterium]|nr:hypothetical protein [Candidatus Saccharimonadales bacterium]
MEEDLETMKKYNSLYLSIIMRYKDYIEEHEGLYVAELPKLVTPADSSVLSVASGITNNFPSYLYDRDFLEAARLAHLYIKERITTLSLPLQFWQKPSETISNAAGDPFDKAVLLCSILIALGGASSKIIITISDGSRDFLVYTEYRDELIVIDLERGITTAHNRDDLLSRLKIGINPELSAYEFNDKMYTNII